MDDSDSDDDPLFGDIDLSGVDDSEGQDSAESEAGCLRACEDLQLALLSTDTEALPRALTQLREQAGTQPYADHFARTVPMLVDGHYAQILSDDTAQGQPTSPTSPHARMHARDNTRARTRVRVTTRARARTPPHRSIRPLTHPLTPPPNIDLFAAAGTAAASEPDDLVALLRTRVVDYVTAESDMGAGAGEVALRCLQVAIVGAAALQLFAQGGRTRTQRTRTHMHACTRACCDHLIARAQCCP